MHSCPYGAITMKTDSEGFYYPDVCAEKCIGCGICQDVCPFHDNYCTNENLDQPIVFAAKHKDEKVRSTSSSGGVFTAISDLILEKKGVIYGAAFDENLAVCHQRAENRECRDLFKGSKYVQSDINSIFPIVKSDLKANRWVLFTGTPCQTAGLKAYLRSINTEKLITCDLVCLGVPSPKLFGDYIKFLSSKFKKRVKSVNFRDKFLGWHKSKTKITFSDGTSVLSNDVSSIYTGLFNRHMALRPSCYSCKFTNFKRPSDITIADFWGIERTLPDFDDNKGVSLVLINSTKGRDLLENFKESLNLKKSTMQNCLQRQLKQPVKIPIQRAQFWNEYRSKGFVFIARKYTGYGYFNKGKKIIKLILLKTPLRGLLRT